jgi:hypothetical protein
MANCTGNCAFSIAPVHCNVCERHKIFLD